MKQRELISSMATECLMNRSRVLARAVTALYDEELRPIGIQGSQLTLLAAIGHVGPVRRSELGRALHLDPSTLTRNLAVLNTNRWITETPDPSDARAALLKITPEGAAVLRRSAPAWQRAQHKAGSMLTTDGVNALLQASKSVFSQ